MAWQRGCTAWRHRGMAAPATTNAVLPPRAVAVGMKTPAASAMVGAQKSTMNKKHGDGDDDRNDNSN